jgi:hypothetical protein
MPNIAVLLKIRVIVASSKSRLSEGYDRKMVGNWLSPKA